jgi:hypothetical protein
VDQALRVRLVQRARHLAEDVEGPRRIQRPFARQHLPEVLALHEPHDEEQHPFGLPGVVDRQDVGVVERGRQPGLTQEPLAEVLVGRELRRQHLQRDAAPQMDVFGRIDDALTTATQFGFDPVVAEQRAGAKVRRHVPWVVSGGWAVGQ